MLSARSMTKKYIEHIITAFSLVIGLAWNSAFQNYFEKNEKLKNHEYGRWIYAIIITIVLIIIMVYLNKFTTYL